MTAKLNAEIGSLTAALYDWHAGRIDQRRWRFLAGACANQAEIERLEAISKYGYKGVDGLRELVATAYLARPVSA